MPWAAVSFLWCWQSSNARIAYLAIDAAASAIFAFTASRLKLAPFCIGGELDRRHGQLLHLLLDKHERQNSYLNQSKYCWAPYLCRYQPSPCARMDRRRS